MGAWEEYLAAAQRLDTLSREASTLVTERAAVTRTGRSELATARQRLSAQRARLTELAQRLGVTVPPLAPDPAERAAANSALAAARAPNAAVAGVAALRSARSTIDAADAALSTLDDPRAPVRPPGRARNCLVYAVAALVACLVPVLLIEFGPTDPARVVSTMVNLGAYCSAVVLPLIGYGVAWLVAGALARRPDGRRGSRDAALGALITVGCVIVVYGAAVALGS
jgi:hypothetical protein